MKNYFAKTAVSFAAAWVVIALPNSAAAAELPKVTTLRAVSTSVSTSVATSTAIPMGFQVFTPSNIISAYGMAKNRVMVLLNGGGTTIVKEKFTAFNGGRGVPSVALSPNKRNLVVVKDDGKLIRSFNFLKGESKDTETLRTSIQSKETVKVYSMHGKHIVVAATRKGKTLKTTTFTLSPSGVLTRKSDKTKTLRASSGALHITRSGNRVIITSGGQAVKYNVTKTGKLTK